MKHALAFVAGCTLALSALAKIPAPVLTDEAKAKAAEAAAKTAWSGKVDAYQLCKAQDRAAASYFKAAKAGGKETKPAKETPACADPGPFVSTLPGAAPPVAAAAAAKGKPAAAAPAKKS